MMFTQLANTVVVLCGMVRENVKGDLSNWIVTVVMLLVLMSFVWDPTGRAAYRIFLPNKINQKWDEVKVLMRKLASKDKEAMEVILRLCSQIGLSVIALDEAVLREHTSQLLGTFGVGAKQADALLDSVGLRLLTWCLRPMLEPTLAKHGLIWEDVLPILETIDSIHELKAAVHEPVAFLEQIAEGSHKIAKKLAIMHLKPPLEPFLAKHGAGVGRCTHGACAGGGGLDRRAEGSGR
jgi:hypothetical protein